MKKDSNIDIEKLYIEEIIKYEVFSPSDELKITKEYYETRDPALKEKIINANLRLVVSTAKKYSNLGLDFLDLISEGNIGLINAVENFDPNLGNKFSSFALVSIKNAIIKALYDKADIVRIPIAQNKMLLKYNEAIYKYMNEDNKMSLDQYLIEQLGCNQKKLNTLKTINLVKNQIYLNSVILPEGNAEDFINLIPSEEKSLYDQMEDEFIKTFFAKIISSFSKKNQDIIKMRYGMEPYSKCYAREKIGKKHNISREGVRLIELFCLKKIKQQVIENDCYDGVEYSRRKEK